MAAGGAPASPKPRSRAPSADLSAEMEKLDEDLMVTKRFLGKVRHFFRLLDANGDGVIEVGEARSRLRVVLLNPDSGMSPQVVKRRLSAGARPQDMKDPEVEAEVERHVRALFDAADDDHDQRITLKDFEHMYAKLLHAHFEPEVLELDLDRAIRALEGGDAPLLQSPAAHQRGANLAVPSSEASPRK